MGQTRFHNGTKPMFKIIEKQGQKVDAFDGMFEIKRTNDHLSSNIYGTYIHGLFDSQSFRKFFINELREKKGIPIVDVIIVPMVLAEDGSRISTTRIKNSEIDLDGKLS